MIKCPKCSKEIFEESRFCPYCMTKFGDVQDYNKIKKRKTKIPGIIISILVVMIIAGVFVFAYFNRDKSSNSEKKEEENQSVNIDIDNSYTNKNDNEEKDYNTYCGTYYNEECTDGTPEDGGGYELNIYSIQNDTVLFSLISYQAPPASRFASVENMVATLKDDKAEFMFSDDGWENAGTGSILFMEDNRIYVNVKLTSANSDAMWDINTDNYFKKVSGEDIDDYVDFSNALGNEFNVIKTKMGKDPDKTEVINEITYYYYDNITVLEKSNKVFQIQVNYNLMDYADKKKYNFTFGINGLTDYKYLSNKYTNIVDSRDSGNMYVTDFKINDRDYLEVTYVGGDVRDMTYYYYPEN